jgi:sec-independent protein translocase protein TatC
MQKIKTFFRNLWLAFRNIVRVIWYIITIPFRLLSWLLSLKEFRQSLFALEEEDTPLPDVVSKVVENPGGTLEHLNELRRHLFRAVIFLLIASSLSLIYFPQILEFLARPLEGGIESLIAITVTEPIGTLMRVALLVGFAFSFPFIAYQIWLFIAPAFIQRRNRVYSLLAIPIASIFFLAGLSFAYYVMLPAAIPFLIGVLPINPTLTVSAYTNFVTNVLFWIGLAFEFPLVIYLLARLGLIKSQMLLEYWKIAFVIIAIVAAMITPTIDPLNMALVMGPLVILYFFSIGLAWIAQRSRERAA